MNRRQRLRLDDLDTDARFHLHRQFIAGRAEDCQDPVQLVFPDNTTTIGYQTESIRSLVEDPRSRLDVGSTPADDSSTLRNSVVVFCSLSGADEIKSSLHDDRKVYLALACFQAVLVVLQVTLAASLETLDRSIVTTLSLAVIPTFGGIASLRFSSADGFAAVVAIQLGSILMYVLNGVFTGTSLEVSIRMVFLAVSMSLVFLGSSVRERLLAQIFIVKQKES